MVIIEKNGLDVPEHLSVEFFNKALEVGLNLSYAEVENVTFSMCCSGVDSFTSLMFRAKVSFTTGATPQQISLVIKCIYYDGMREVFKASNVYGKEVLMYTKVLPALEKMLKVQNISDQIAPRLIYYQDDPMNTIVFQDLNELRLILGNRSHGLDEDHSKLVMTKIGQFHAASMILARDQPEMMHRFNISMFDKKGDCPGRDNIFRRNLYDMADLVEMWPGFEKIAEKLRRITEDFYDRAQACINQKAAFKVLNHGDLWVNNCMFKHVNGRPKDLLLIDFQMSYYASPAFDLHYFLYSGVQLGVLVTKRYTLLRTYYNALRNTLEAMEYEKIPTWEDLKNEMRATEFLGFWAFEAILPLHAMDKADSADAGVESFSDDTNTRKIRQTMFSSERFLSTIRYSLDRFDELGVLD